jgi:hypothetical protein
VPFYELDLPEFKLPVDQLELLDEAFRMEIEEAPGQAKFAYSARMFGFAEDWYNTLLRVLKEDKGAAIALALIIARYIATIRAGDDKLEF